MALLENYVAQPPPLRELENGAVRIEGTRVSLDSVIICYNQGRTAEDIVRSFPTLKLRDVYLVIAYYLDNKEVVDAYIQAARGGDRMRRCSGALKQTSLRTPSFAKVSMRVSRRKRPPYDAVPHG